MKKIIFIISILIVTSCNQKKETKNSYTKITGFAQGTTYSIIYKDINNQNYKDDIEKILNDFDLSLSTYKAESIISRINKNDNNVELDNYFIEIIKKSQEITKLSDGAFDITIAPLVNAWGFGLSKKSVIDSSLVDSLLQFVGMDKIKIVDNRITKSHPSIMLDVNAIAQGYSVDVIGEFLESKNIHDYLVEIGGELKAKGKNHKNKLWRVGIDKPIENTNQTNRELQVILKLSNKSLATSGNYRKFYEENGLKYSHSINPKTGYPAKHNLLSATIIADNCMDADGYATACMVLGLEKAKALINKLEHIDAYLIYSDNNGEYKVYYTPQLKSYIGN